MALAAILTMYGAFLFVGWAASRKVKDGSAEDLIVAGRSMPVWLATLTMTATWVDGGYLLGTAEGAYKSSITLGLQGGLCFGISLILGGVLFAKRMRELEFTTLIDPFEARFGAGWAVVLFLPAVLGEIFWSAELLAAIGSTVSVVLKTTLVAAIILSAVVVIVYTMVGGMWSVAYTDALQLGLVVLGLAVALPFALGAAGGLDAAWTGYLAARPDRGILTPPLHGGSFWTSASIVTWWDTSAMLVLGGIPWNCYFQRVLSCQTPRKAQLHSVLAGLLTIAMTIPPLLMGIAAFRYPWRADLLAQLEQQPSQALPMLFQYVTPPLVALLGLGAIIGAVTSSFSSSVLSAATMVSWNGYRKLVRQDVTPHQMMRLIRLSVVLLGAVAVVMALRVQSVQALWFFTSDLIFVLLFPQLLFALFDPKVNRAGSIAAFAVALLLRLGGGEPLFGIPAFIAYPEWLPFKTLAAASGLLLLPIVSRLTARWDPPRGLRRI